MSNVKVWTLHLEDGYFVPDVELRDNENMVCVIKKADHEAAIANKDAEIDRLGEALKVCAFYADSTSRDTEKDARISELEDVNADLLFKLANKYVYAYKQLSILESANAGLTEILKYIGTGLDPRTVHYSEVFGEEVVKPFNNMRSMSEYAFKALAKLAKGEK